MGDKAAATAATAEAAPLMSYGVPTGPPFHQEPFDPPLLQSYILVPIYHLRRRSRGCRCASPSSRVLLYSTFLVVVVVLLLPALFLLWPTDPSVQLVRIELHNVRVVTNPSPILDVSMDLSLRVRNPNFFSLDYDSLVSSIAYHGRALGFVTSARGRIKARGVSYIDACLRLNGIRVVSDMFYFIEDLAKGSIPFDTITEVDGRLQVLFLQIPVEGKISCAISVDPGNQTIVHQECSPA